MDRRWPWGDAQPDDTRLNFNGQVQHTTPVGRYPTGASPYDVLDLAGNVWEWCLNGWANPYEHPDTNDPEDDSPRVVRGGSWFNNEAQARCAYRLRLPANLRYDHDVGFRVAGGITTLRGEAHV
jgi:formylglycine-generating enzyme required for sulfatase activity